MRAFLAFRIILAALGWAFLGFMVVVALSGCANYEKARECQRQAGPRPHQLASAFGLVGSVWSLDQPDTQAYNHAVDACMQEAGR